MRPGVPALVFVCLGALTGLPRTVSAQGSGEYQKLVAQYCATCHSDRQKAAGLSLQGSDLTRLDADPGTWEKVARKVGAGGDASGRRAASRPGLARRPGQLADSLARSAGGGQSQPGPPGAAPPEPCRVRQRDPRPVGARNRCVFAAAARSDQPRVRQHGGRARRVAGAVGAVSFGRRPHQRPGGRRSADRRRRRNLRHPGRQPSTGSRRGPAARYARRPAHHAALPVGRRLRHQREAVSQQQRLHPRPGVAPRSRVHRGRQAGLPEHRRRP